MNLFRFCWVMAAFVPLAACGDHVNGASVRNATGNEVYVLHASDHEDRNALPMGSRWSWPWSWRVLIANGEGAILMYDVLSPWVVEIDDGQCQSWYRVPTHVNHSGRLSLTDVQLEPDRLLYAVPYDGEFHAINIQT